MGFVGTTVGLPIIATSASMPKHQSNCFIDIQKIVINAVLCRDLVDLKKNG